MNLNRLYALFILLFGISCLCTLEFHNISVKSGNGGSTAVALAGLPASAAMYTGLDLAFILLPVFVLAITRKMPKSILVAIIGCSAVLLIASWGHFNRLLDDRRGSEIKRIFPDNRATPANYMRYAFYVPVEHSRTRGGDGESDFMEYQPFLGLRAVGYAVVAVLSYWSFKRRKLPAPDKANTDPYTHR